MNSKDALSKGPKRHDSTCYRVERDIVIPAGTILRAQGEGKFAAPVGPAGEFSIATKPGQVFSEFKLVVAP